MKLRTIAVVVVGMIMVTRAWASIPGTNEFPDKSGVALLGAPVANNDDNYGPEDLAQNGNVALNDSDPDGDPLTFTVVVPPAHGTLTLQPNGQYTYVPNQEYVGFDYATYQACDPGGLCDQATIEFAMTFVNDLPFVNPDSYVVGMDGTLSANVQANDYDIDIEPLFTSVLLPPSNAASFSLSLNGSFTYVPLPGFTGTDSFFYQACDPCEACQQAWVTITVIDNDPPVANNDYHFTSLNTPLDLTVAQNDSDPNGDILTYSVIVQPIHGDIVMNANGTYVYTPDPFFSGFDYITYQACDPQGACDTAVLEVEVVFVNVTPVAVDDSFSGNEDQVITGSVATNDYDPNVEVLTFPLLAGPTVGTISWNPQTGGFTYTPPANWHGTQTIVYNACDPCNACDVGTLTITVLPVNDAPLAVSDVFVMDEDEVNQWDVSLNDSDAEGDLLAFSLLSQASYGTVVMEADGSFTYTPSGNYSGSDVFSYSVCDPGGACSSAIASITLNAVNDAPMAMDDFFTTNEDVPVAGSLATNDTDPEGDVLTYAILDGPDFGEIVLANAGSFTYTPDPNFFGIDQVTYTVSDGNGGVSSAVAQFTIVSVNDAPLANADSFQTNEDVSVSASVSGNDSDVESGSLTYSVQQSPQHGALVLQASGSFVYTPAANYFGADQFVYTVCDPQGACATATVSLTMLPVNDVPVVQDENMPTPEDTPLSGSVAFNDYDVDGDPLTYEVVNSADYGVFSMDAQGNFTYTPDLDFIGSDMVVYHALDGNGGADLGTLIIEVGGINDAPVAAGATLVVDEDSSISGSLVSLTSDPDNDVLVFSIASAPEHGVLDLLSNGSYTYTPDTDYYGDDYATYAVSDGNGGSAQAELHFVVNFINDLPQVNNETLSTNEDQVLTGSVALNDVELDIEPLFYQVIVAPSSGTVVMTLDGSFTFTPVANFSGNVTVTYMGCDPCGACDVGVLTIQVLPVNDVPVGQDDAFSTNEDVVLSASVATNDSDIEAGALTYSVQTNVQFGTLVLNSGGSFTYTPAANYTGPDSFVYQVCDGQGACDLATVSLTVIAVNDPPVALTGDFTIDEDDVLDGSVASLASDVESGTLTFSLSTAPALGTIELQPDGSFGYTPPGNFNGTVTWNYQVCDGSGSCSQAVISILVLPVNDPPVAVSNTFAGLMNSTISGNVGLNDSDVDGETLTFSLTESPGSGSMVFNEDGTFAFTPESNEFGAYAFVYTACDPLGACASAELTIIVSDSNTMPVASNEEVSGDEDTIVSGDVSVNDVDPDGGDLSYTLLENPETGNLTLFSDGTFSYTPPLHFNGTVTATYEACDLFDACSAAVLTIVIQPVNDAPVAIGEEVDLMEDETINWGVSANDTDVDGDVLTFTLLEQPENGMIAFEPDGSFYYVPLQDFFGLEILTYQVCDPSGACAEAELTIDVNFVNDLPVAVDETFYLSMNETLEASVGFNDIEIDPEPLSYGLLAIDEGGALTLELDGTFTFLPNDGFTGTITATYMACDPCGACDIGVVTFVVGNVNTSPVVVDATVDGCAGLSQEYDLDQWIMDPDEMNNGLQVSVLGSTGGNWTLNPFNHDVVFTPAADFFGTAVLTYQVCDTGTPVLCAEGVLSVNVYPSVSPIITSVSIQDSQCFDDLSGWILLETDAVGAQLEFDWSNGSTDEDIIFLEPGSYTVTITALAECGLTISETYVVEGPDAPLAIEGLDAVIEGGNMGGSTSYTVTGGTEPYSFSWVYVDGGNVEVSTDQVLSGIGTDAQGTYMVYVTDANGCVATGSIDITVGLTEQENSTVLVLYPNPAMDVLNVRFTGDRGKLVRLEMLDATGRLVLKEEFPKSRQQDLLEFDISRLAAGTYTTRITLEGSIVSLPVIKQ